MQAPRSLPCTRPVQFSVYTRTVAAAKQEGDRSQIYNKSVAIRLACLAAATLLVNTLAALEEHVQDADHVPP
jgi:hypothetical protein